MSGLNAVMVQMMGAGALDVLGDSSDGDRRMQANRQVNVVRSGAEREQLTAESSGSPRDIARENVADLWRNPGLAEPCSPNQVDEEFRA